MLPRAIPFIVTVAVGALASASSAGAQGISVPSDYGPYPPQVTGAPPATTTSTDAEITWTNGVRDVSVVCAVDAQDRLPRDHQICTSPLELTGLQPGTHQVWLWGKNPTGYSAQKTVSWTVVAPPSAPAGVVADSRCTLRMPLGPCDVRRHPLLTLTSS